MSTPRAWTLDEATIDLINSPGQSLLRRLRDPSDDWRPYQFTEHGNARMVSDGRLKLVRRFPPLDVRFRDELYDLAADPRETANLLEDERYRDRIDRLARALGEHLARFEVAGTEWPQRRWSCPHTTGTSPGGGPPTRSVHWNEPAAGRRIHNLGYRNRASRSSANPGPSSTTTFAPLKPL